MSRTLQLTEQLIARPSVTPADEGCLDMIADLLSPLGFVCERLDSGPTNFRVSNLWALRNSSVAGAKTVVFVGHTDVVP
ncbi:MAG: succinyl-diaminopimelate desuccinylase, partial [Comamonas sp.]